MVHMLSQEPSLKVFVAKVETWIRLLFAPVPRRCARVRTQASVEIQLNDSHIYIYIYVYADKLCARVWLRTRMSVRV